MQKCCWLFGCCNDSSTSKDEIVQKKKTRHGGLGIAELPIDASINLTDGPSGPNGSVPMPPVNLQSEEWTNVLRSEADGSSPLRGRPGPITSSAMTDQTGSISARDGELRTFAGEIDTSEGGNATLTKENAKDAIKNAWKIYTRELGPGIQLNVVLDGHAGVHSTTPQTVKIGPEKKSLIVGSETFVFSDVESVIRSQSELSKVWPSMPQLEQVKARTVAMVARDGRKVAFIFRDSETAKRFFCCLKINRHMALGKKGAAEGMESLEGFTPRG